MGSVKASVCSGDPAKLLRIAPPSTSHPLFHSSAKVFETFVHLHQFTQNEVKRAVNRTYKPTIEAQAKAIFSPL